MIQIFNGPSLASSVTTNSEETSLILNDDLSLEHRKSSFTKKPLLSFSKAKKEGEVKGSVDLLCKEHMAIPFTPSLLNIKTKERDNQKEDKKTSTMLHESDGSKRGCTSQHSSEPIAKVCSL